MSITKLELNEERVALLDAALSLLHQTVVSQIGAIKEDNQVYGETEGNNELLEGAEEVKADIEELFRYIDMQQTPRIDKDKMRKLKRLKKRSN